ncbi:MAG TPA: Crp/Fnr family transcriptional regulator [Blastocatellia bacterium]|nr:Crp/Fnr family transcriptional regulator [Blastocatellia bacterium]
MSDNNRVMYARVGANSHAGGDRAASEDRAVSFSRARPSDPGTVEKLLALSRVTALNTVPAAAMNAMARAAVFADFEKGDVIYNVGEPIDSLCLVSRGRVISSCFSPGGRALMKLILRNGVFSEVLVDANYQGRCQVRAHIDTRLCRIDEADFLRLCEMHPALATALARLMTERWTQTLQDLEDTVFLNARQRALKLLDKLSNETRDEVGVGGRPLIEFSQDELARLTGVTRERMNCVLRSLEDAAVIQIRPRALRINSVNLAQAMIEEGLGCVRVQSAET